MNLRQCYFLSGVTIVTILFLGLGCDQKEQEKLRVLSIQGTPLKVATAPSLVTITINPGGTAATQCTANVPWQELYTRAGAGNNDFIRFQASNQAPQQTYRVTFPNTPLDTATIDNITATPTGVHQVAIDPAAVCGPPSGNVCAYPYNIYNITVDPAHPVPCNNGNAGPPYGVGSDGVIIKGG